MFLANLDEICQVKSSPMRQSRQETIPDKETKEK